MNHHTLAAMSITGTCLDVRGSLYLAYDLLGGRYGPLRLLTRAVTYSIIFGIGYGLGLGLFFGFASGIATGITVANAGLLQAFVDAHAVMHQRKALGGTFNNPWGDKPQRGMKSRARALVERLSAIESILVDPKRMSARDVLRHPAGLNDTLLDMIAMTTTADAAPTTQTKAVSKETMAKIDEQLAKLDALVARDVAPLNAMLAKARIGHVAA